LAFNVTLAVTAIDVAWKDGNDQCIGNYKGISFSYGTWLLIFGWTDIAEVAAVLVVIAGLILSLQMHNETCAEGLGMCAICLFAVCETFQFAWYVVGAVSFFAEVAPSCPQGSRLYDFGLALFVIKTVLFGCCCLLGGNQKSDK
jgi:hypothetical protein